MASGMEFSARMISLAINIALMGLVLAKGVTASFVGMLPPRTDLGQLVDLVSAGNFAAADAAGIPVATARTALTHGFGWVTLYGFIAPLILGIGAAFVFDRKRAKPPRTNEVDSIPQEHRPELTTAD